MIRYATTSDFLVKYPNTGVSSADLYDVWLGYGATRLNEVLGAAYTVPFSSNNATARDLSVDFAHLGLRARTVDPADAEEMQAQIDQRLAALLESRAPMITDSGDAIFASGGLGDEIWSTTKDYKPVFDQRAPYRQRVDPDLLQALEDADD